MEEVCPANTTGNLDARNCRLKTMTRAWEPHQLLSDLWEGDADWFSLTHHMIIWVRINIRPNALFLLLSASIYYCLIQSY